MGEVTSTPTRPALLQVEAVHKRFGGAVALRGADLTLSRAGRVHCLAGENGSGKSTMLGIVSGTHSPDSGRVLDDGEPVTFRQPYDAIRRGIAMVSQETTIAPDLTVAENVLLGNRLVRSRFGVDWVASRRKAAEVLGRLELDYDPTATVGRLAAHQRQMIEIARALSMDTRILILDEPTSSLTGEDVDALMTVVRRLAIGGVSVVFVSHRLPEVFALCDDVTVLRDGATVAEGPVSAFTPHTLVAAMVGDRTRRNAAVRTRTAATTPTPAALEVTNLSVEGVLSNVSLRVVPGEIVGLAGLVASGRSELLEVVFGVRSRDTGDLAVGGRPYSPTGPRNAIKAGIGYLPPDRKTQGLVLNMSVRDNLSLAATSGAPSVLPPDRRRQNTDWRNAVDTMRIRASSANAPAATLSGGNQQKVALAKWVACRPVVLLLDEPTRGVDVGAKADIYAWLKGTVGTDIGIVVSSSEYEELLELCDRILVMASGRVVAHVRADQTSEAALAALAGGQA